MLMSLWIAEIGQHTVAHVLRDKAAVALDQFGAAAVIGADDAPQILGVEPRRQRRRAHEIAEHHRELTALGGILWPSLGRVSGSRRGWGDAREPPDRTQHLAAIAEHDAEVFRILVRQVSKDGQINAVLGKALPVLGQAERCQPLRSRGHGFALGDCATANCTASVRRNNDGRAIPSQPCSVHQAPSSERQLGPRAAVRRRVSSIAAWGQLASDNARR